MKTLSNSIKKKLIDGGIKDAYERMALGNVDSLSGDDHEQLLAAALVLVNSNDEETSYVGYSIICRYSLITKNYAPLLDLSVQLNNSPVSKMLLNLKENDADKSLGNIIEEIWIENYERKGIYYTQDQLDMQDRFGEKLYNDVCVVAPTSFGKSDLVKEFVLQYYRDCSICIIVPTKALVSQVRRDLVRMFGDDSESHKVRVVTHYDTDVSSSTRNIFVLTQERLFKLVFDKGENTKFDFLLVDEAHDVMKKDGRAILLAELIGLLRDKNPKLAVKFFSPVVADEDNLAIDCSIYPREVEHRPYGLRKSPKIKIDNYHLADFENGKEFWYDEVFDNFVCESETIAVGRYDYIMSRCGNKNLIYFNKPRDAKKEAVEFAKKLPEVSPGEVDDMVKSLADYISDDYDLIDCIRHGVAYHFGGMPENVRSYVEEWTKKSGAIKYVFCTSTLLEGVNMPFDKMFICDNKVGRSKMSYMQLKNLLGRVNRYNDIFNFETNDVERLCSDIYFLTGDVCAESFKHFMRERLKYGTKARVRKDVVENPLLAASNKKDVPEAVLQSIATLSNGENMKESRVETPVGRAMVNLNITDCNIKLVEQEIQKRLEALAGQRLEVKGVIEKIYELFLVGNEEHFGKSTGHDNDILALYNENARIRYQMVIDQKVRKESFKRRVMALREYWGGKNKRVFIGSKWGEESFDGSNKNNGKYINVMDKTSAELVNYAILRVEQEDGSVDFCLLKYIELLFKFNLIDEKDFQLIKYGTNSRRELYFIKDGLSVELVGILLSGRYDEYIKEQDGGYYIERDIIGVFDGNDVLRNELEYYLGASEQ